MKKISIPLVCLLSVQLSFSQDDRAKYPDTEFANEIYYLKKDSTWAAVRLEKGISDMDTKMKMAGFGGGESGYFLEGEKSSVRLGSGSNLSFIYSTGASKKEMSTQSDSFMRANGFDPSELQGMGGMDPTSMITLYKAEKGKGERKFLIMSTPGAMGFSGKKKQANKYTFSVRKIREGYWELVVDKPLPAGEYAFAIMSHTGSGSQVMYSFGIN